MNEPARNQKLNLTFGEAKAAAHCCPDGLQTKSVFFSIPLTKVCALVLD